MEGIKAAKANGVKFGRPRIVVTEAFYIAAEKWKKGDLSMQQAANEAGLSLTTFYRRVKLPNCLLFDRTRHREGNVM